MRRRSRGSIRLGKDPAAFAVSRKWDFCVASNPRAMGSAAVSLQASWQAFDALFADPRVGYVDEPAGIEAVWRSVTQHQSLSPQIWNDAYLAAFAQIVDFEIVSFDQGFSQYSAMRRTILT